MLVFFGKLYGGDNGPAYLQGMNIVDIVVPSFASLIIGTSGILTLPIQITVYRERRILRRLKATPLSPQKIIFSHIIMIFLMTLLGMTLLIATAKLLFDLTIPRNMANVLFAFTLGSISFFSMGFVLAGVLKTARTGQVVSMIIYYPMIFLSGSTIPIEVMPENFRTISKALPLSYLVVLFRGVWTGNPLGDYMREILMLLLFFVVCVIISSRVFKWE